MGLVCCYALFLHCLACTNFPLLLHVQTEMMDVLSADPQELTACVSRSKGLVLMCPPTTSAEARVSLAAMTSALKSGTKVRCGLCSCGALNGIVWQP
jgi:hypothetical protein